MYNTKWKQSQDDARSEIVEIVDALESEFGHVDGQLIVPDDEYESLVIEVYNMDIDEAADVFTDMERHVLNIVGVSGYSIGTSGNEATLKLV